MSRLADSLSMALERLRDLAWPRLLDGIEAEGFATTGPLLDARECEALSALYDQPGPFRSRIVMARHGFGQGEYQYFGDPLPAGLLQLRAALYAELVGLANRWRRQLGQPADFPAEHADFLQICHAAGQCRPTPLLLKYRPGDYNCLHQDLYGERVFPLQATLLLSRPEADFTGGEFVLVEQRPRRQSRVRVVPLGQGEAVIFAGHQRPERGHSGWRRVQLRHGVSPLGSGQRYVLGLPLHDAA